MQPFAHRSLVLIADVGTDHFHVGDEAMLEANIAALRRYVPDVELHVFGRSAAAAAEQHRIAAALEHAGGLFISGGGNMCSTWPDLIRQRVFALAVAQRLGLPIVTGGQTIGPELTWDERSALVRVLGGVTHLGVREAPSAAMALALGVPSDRVVYQVDDAFLLAGSAPRTGVIPARLDEPFLAVTLDASFAAETAAGELRGIAGELAAIAAQTGLHLAFVPHVGPLGEIGDGDGAVGFALRELLAHHRVPCTLMPVMDAAATVWITQRAAAVVSSRYHPIVFGTAAAVPCIGIHRDEYTRVKLAGALAHAGLASWTQPGAGAAAGGLSAAFRRLWSEREAMRETMTAARARVEAQEQRRWTVLMERLGWMPAQVSEPPPLPPLLGWHRTATSTLQRSTSLTEEQWSDYDRLGFLNLGRLLDDDALAALRRRADDLATGRVSNSGVQMQLDTGGAYDELPGVVGSALGTLRYRKIQGLELDDVFSPLVRHPLFLDIAARHYGPHAPVSIFRAMVMNKPAQQGTVLPWHQDGGDVWALDRDPLVTIWVALDDATIENGCVEVVPGSHRLGLLSAFGSTLTDDDAARHCPADNVLPLQVKAGHGLLMHNWLIHRSGVNPSSRPRRAFTACYMDGRTQNTVTGVCFPLVGGSLPVEPYAFIRQLHHDLAALRKHVAGAEEYATSLAEDNQQFRVMVREATVYARSLESELAQAIRTHQEAERYAKSLEAARRVHAPPLVGGPKPNVAPLTEIATSLDRFVAQATRLREDAERFANS